MSIRDGSSDGCSSDLLVVLLGATGDQCGGGEADGQQAKRVRQLEVPRCKKGASAPVAGDYSGFSGDVRTASVSVSDAVSDPAVSAARRRDSNCSSICRASSDSSSCERSAMRSIRGSTISVLSSATLTRPIRSEEHTSELQSLM